MKFILPCSETVTVTGQAIEKLLRAGDGAAALLYLYILKTNGGGTAEEAAVILGKTGDEISAAMALLNRLGLVIYECGDTQTRQPDKQSAPPPPEQDAQYTIDEVRRELENGSTFSALVDEAQSKLGKIFSQDELLRLFGIYDGLRLPPEVILYMITHCIEESRGKNGNGRMPTMRYIEKVAYTWEREGIFTLESADEHIRNLERQRSVRGEIKKALQIKDREFSSSERRYADSWAGMGFSADAIEIAYDRTVLKTGKLAWGYMDSILKSWHSKGLHTPAEISAKDSRGKTTQKAAPQKTQKYGVPSSDDIRRMEKLLQKIKED